MRLSPRGIIARAAYGALFVLVVPVWLLAIARVGLPLPAPRLPVLGWTLAGLGLTTLALGMLGIVRQGRGLPMNAFPPDRLVTSGIFALVPHPIYTGFCVACAGASLAIGSAGGLYLATPIAVLGCLALVLGHERLVLLRRFGTLPDPLLGPRRLRPLARLLRLDRLWAGLLALTEQLANSWSARRIGPIRIMSHALYSGLAGGVGAAGVVLVVGTARAWLVGALMVAGTLGAAIVGQLLVGSSSRLSRPFGYFGGLLAISVLGGAWVLAHPHDAVLLGAFALMAPWTQALGRLRCIVQGCCHGSPTTPAHGIVVTNPHSRVCALAALCGAPLHPTALYSLLGNLALGPALALLWQAGAPLAVVMGGYLVGAGTIRFIEEAYRGEPLTPIVSGLRIYQWFAVAMVAVGALIVLIPSATCPPVALDAWPLALAAGAVFFVVCGAALSVDLPESTARFSRLSG